MSYDARRQRIVLFGGDAGNGALGDTWERNGTAWTSAAAAASVRRAAPLLVYNAARQRVQLYGGFDTSARNELWEYDGTSWSKVR